MPYANRKRKTYRRRKPVHKPRTRRSGAARAPRSNFQPSRVRSLPKPSVGVQRGASFFPNTLFARLKYTENYYISADGTTGLSAIGYAYSANNTYDPRYSFGGKQPLEYDQITAIYKFVRDHACKITITFSNPTHDGMWVGYRVRSEANATATAGQSHDYLATMQWTQIAPLNNTGKQTKTFSFFVPCYQVFGVTKVQYQDAIFGHVWNNSPGVNALVEPFAIHSITGETAQVRYEMKMTFYSQFHDKTTPAES